MANPISVEVAERTLKIARRFDALRAMVFKAYTDGEALKQWFGPEGWPLTVSDMDFRVGGSWHYCMSGPDGAQAWGLAMLDEIVEPERVVYRDAFSDADRNVVPPTSDVTVEFIERGPTSTSLQITIVFASNEERDNVIAMGMEEGMAQTLEHLAEYLAKQQA